MLVLNYAKFEKRLTLPRSFTNRSSNPVVLKAKAEFIGIERIVSFEKGDEVLKLLHLITVAFSDVGLNKVPPASVELLKYVEGIQDFVRLHPDLKLVDDLQVKVGYKKDQVQ